MSAVCKILYKIPHQNDDEIEGDAKDDQEEQEEERRWEEEDDPDLNEGFFLHKEIVDKFLPEMKTYHNLIAKVRKIVKFFRYDLKNEFLQLKILDIQTRNLAPPRPVKLTLDVRIRWNSIISMLDKFLKVYIYFYS